MKFSKQKVSLLVFFSLLALPTSTVLSSDSKPVLSPIYNLLLEDEATGLQVTLEKLVEVAPQALGQALSVPYIVNGEIHYKKMDINADLSTFGIYRGNGAGIPVAIGSTQIDGSSASGYDIDDADSSNLLASGSSDYLGIINTSHGAIFSFPTASRIIDRLSPVPGYPVPHPGNSYINSRIDGTKIAFHVRRYNASPMQISAVAQLQGGVFSIIAKEGDSIPGTTETFGEFENTSLYLNGGKVLFIGKSENLNAITGIFEADGTLLTKLVDQNTLTPSNTMIGKSFHQNSIAKSGNQYVFINSGNGFAPTLYRIMNGALDIVAEKFDKIPDGVGDFFYFDSPSIKDGKVVFIGGRSNQFLPPVEMGIYTDISGTIETIVDLQTNFGGKTATSFSMSTGKAWVGDSVYFHVNFTDNSEAIYKAKFSIPDAN